MYTSGAGDTAGTGAIAPGTSAGKRQLNWQKVKSVAGLYRKTQTGGYFSRYSLNGRRTFRTLETDVLTVAKLRHSERLAENEKDRQAGASIDTVYRTLGALAEEFARLVEASERSPGSKSQYQDRLLRLQENWQRGQFDTFPVRHVTHDVIFELREHLLNRAEVRMARRWRASTHHRKARGFAPTVVNQTIWVLGKLLDIAVEKRVVIENPFATVGTLRGGVWLTRQPKKKELPDRSVVERVFAELRVVPKKDLYDSGRQTFFQNRANEAADHAEFLALTGMRLQEANSAMIEDDRGEVLRVRGTKSETSARVIPVHPALRRLLDRLKRHRASGPLLAAKTSLAPLKRACSRLGVGILTHHHLRHYFATVCIESGIDIPTVSRFMGHADGGVLALKTYGHLRDEHALAMGRKIDFSSSRKILPSGKKSR